jgi:hypothetical protein
MAEGETTLEYVVRLDRARDAIERLAVDLAERGYVDAATVGYEFVRELDRVARAIAP